MLPESHDLLVVEALDPLEPNGGGVLGRLQQTLQRHFARVGLEFPLFG